MPRDRQEAGPCPKCEAHPVQCTYNHFEREDLRIDSWEHKCTNCGWRETRAFRSDEPASSDTSPTVCPYCQRSAA